MEQFGWDTNDEFPIETSSTEKTLYLHSLGEHSCISHDGYIQLDLGSGNAIEADFTFAIASLKVEVPFT